MGCVLAVVVRFCGRPQEINPSKELPNPQDKRPVTHGTGDPIVRCADSTTRHAQEIPLPPEQEGQIVQLPEYGLALACEHGFPNAVVTICHNADIQTTNLRPNGGDAFLYPTTAAHILDEAPPRTPPKDGCRLLERQASVPIRVIPKGDLERIRGRGLKRQ